MNGFEALLEGGPLDGAWTISYGFYILEFPALSQEVNKVVSVKADSGEIPFEPFRRVTYRRTSQIRDGRTIYIWES